MLGTLETILIITTALEFNPLIQAIKILRKHETKGISVITYIMILAIGNIMVILRFEDQQPAFNNWKYNKNANKPLAVIVIYFKMK